MVTGPPDMPPDTLGVRLAEAGRRLAVRHLCTLPWEGPLRLLLARAGTLARPVGERFERAETTDRSGRPASPNRPALGLRRSGVPAVAGPAPTMPGRLPGEGIRRFPEAPEPLREAAGTTAIARTAEPAATSTGPVSDERPASVPGLPGGPVAPAARASGSAARSPRATDVIDEGADADSTPEGAPGHRPGRRLPTDVRSRLRGIAGPGVDALFVHDDAAADALAGRHHADAVTVGRDVHLRSGRLRPDTAEGFALLAHEASHVSAGLTGAGHRAGSGGRSAEEDVALAAEGFAHRAFRTGGAAPQRPVPPSTPGVPLRARSGEAAQASHADTHAHVMAARTDREFDTGAGIDVEQLRRTLVSDLMRQLRTEFERGG
jgi:hypothetical protein